MFESHLYLECYCISWGHIKQWLPKYSHRPICFELMLGIISNLPFAHILHSISITRARLGLCLERGEILIYVMSQWQQRCMRRQSYWKLSHFGIVMRLYSGMFWATAYGGNWSKRRQTETSTTKTSTNQNVDKPKRRQTETSTDQNVDKPKGRQTKTSTN